MPAGTRYVVAGPGLAALHDVAMPSAMYGMFAGITHAFALGRGADVAPGESADVLVPWLDAMAGMAHRTAERLESGDRTSGVVCTRAMQVAGAGTLLRTAREQGVSAELLTPFLDLAARRLADGHGQEDTAGLVDLLRR